MNYLYKYTEVNMSAPFGKHFKSIAILESGFCRYASPQLSPIAFPNLYSIMMYFTFYGIKEGYLDRALEQTSKEQFLHIQLRAVWS